MTPGSSSRRPRTDWASYGACISRVTWRRSLRLLEEGEVDRAKIVSFKQLSCVFWCLVCFSGDSIIFGFAKKCRVLFGFMKQILVVVFLGGNWGGEEICQYVWKKWQAHTGSTCVHWADRRTASHGQEQAARLRCAPWTEGRSYRVYRVYRWVIKRVTERGAMSAECFSWLVCCKSDDIR